MLRAGREWLGLGALLAGAILLWVGFALAIVVAALAGVALLASQIRRLWARQPAARGPVVIEGQFTEIK